MITKGKFIGERYEIIDKVGSGGMSDVYKAKDHKLGRFVAVKVLKQEFSEDKSFVSKFKIEAQSAAGLSHPNIVNIFDVGEDNGLYYIVMELIEGITLKTYINRKGKLPIKEAVSIAVQVAQGIEAAHNNHIIHRDIKPQNIMISREGKVKVTDFGIARAASANTINSNAMGSVHYISPEQARNGYVDEKSDIYSLGITLYEMITGKVPFEGDSTVSIALAHVQDEIPPMSLYVENIPISVEKIVEKCTQKKPDRRYLKVSSLIADLKKSLVSPDEDFVQLIPSNTTPSMVMISEDEINVIKKDAGIDDLLADIDDEAEENIKERHVSDIDIDEKEEDDFDEFDGQNMKVDKIVTIGSIVAAVVILIIAIFVFGKFLGGCSKGKTTNNNGTTTTDSEESSGDIDSRKSIVPSLIGRTSDDAVSLLEEVKLLYKFEYTKSNTIEAGRVIEQKTKAGEIIDKGSTVVLVVSEGNEDIEVKDVIGKTKEEAEKILKEQGFEVSSEAELNNDVEAGLVISTNPVAGKKISYGSKITILVSLGKDQKVEVPDVKNMTEAQAEATLNDKGFQMKKTYENHSTVTKGHVIVQDVKAGSIIDLSKDSNLVSVTISLGPKEIETTTAADTKYEAVFGEITKLDGISELTEVQLEGAYLTAEISYKGKGNENATVTEDITYMLSGYSDDTKNIPYTSGWVHNSIISISRDVDKNATINLTVILHLADNSTIVVHTDKDYAR